MYSRSKYNLLRFFLTHLPLLSRDVREVGPFNIFLSWEILAMKLMSIYSNNVLLGWFDKLYGIAEWLQMILKRFRLTSLKVSGLFRNTTADNQILRNVHS